MQSKITPRGGAVVARWAHNPKVVGSSPAPATKKADSFESAFLFFYKSLLSNLIALFIKDYHNLWDKSGEPSFFSGTLKSSLKPVSTELPHRL